VFLISQVFVNCAPGLKIVPSGMVSLTRLALPHLDIAVLEGRVGEAGAASGVSVGENSKGVWVTMGAEGVDEFALSAVS
jgi:hypothetical protein